MRMIFADIETFFSKEYSLRHLTVPEYVLDPRFELICVSAQVDDGPIQFIDGPDFATWLKQFDPADTIMVCYNSLFDSCAIAWRYHFVPARLIDVLGMARCLLGHKLRRLSLDSVAKHLGAGDKGTVLQSVVGMNRQAIVNAGLWPFYQAYNMQDVRIMRNIYDQLAPKFPKAEWRIMDLVLRCAVQPQFVADLPRLEAHLTKVRADKEQLLASANVEKAQLMSAAAFVALLEAEGVEVETKISGTGNEIPAVAKTDRFMADLAEHENPRVQALAAARLGFKSTIDETRTERLIAIAKLDWPMAGLPTHSMPVPLKYGGARTHRLSGDWRINMQSLPRGSLLREALTARPGFKIVVADYAQIEARIVAWFCQANVLLKAFAANQDPYLVMGGFIFDRPITKEDKLERHISKAAVLGLGYGLGPDNFYLKTQAAARLQGLDLGDIWTPGLAKRTVEVYRRVNAPIKTMWRLLDDKLHHEWLGLAPPAAIGPMTIGHGYIENPYGLRMLYDNPRAEMGSELIYDYGGVPHKMWGANALENISQHLARVLVTNASIRLKQLGYSMIHQAHDELIFSVKEDEIDRALQIIHNQMVQVPSWGLGLPLGVDIGHGDNYGTAK